MDVVEQGEWYRDRCGRYGIRLRLSSGKALMVADVATSAAEAERLIRRLRGELVDEEQLRYLIEDYVISEYSV